MSGWHNYRTVIESAEVEAKVDALKRQYDRFDDQWDGFTWLVSRTPEEISLRKVVGEKEYRLAHRKGDMSVGLPDFAVIFTFDPNEVEIIAIEAWDSIDD